LIVFKTRIEFSTDRRFVFMSDVIGNPEYPKVKVIRERTPTKIEEKINDLVARGFELRGQVEFGVLDPKLQGGGERYVATMVKTS